MKPLQHACYKGTGGKFGAIQWNLQDPHFYKDRLKSYSEKDVFEMVEGKYRMKSGWKKREGCVFVEMASATGKNLYNWSESVTMALSINDLGKLLFFLVTGKSSSTRDEDKTMTIMHDPHAKSDRQGQIKKYLKFTSPKGTAAGCLVTITKMDGEQRLSHMVPMSGDELLTLRTLVQQAIARSIAW